MSRYGRGSDPAPGEVGSSLLAEIESEREGVEDLRKFLSSLRFLPSLHQHPTFHLPFLDRIISFLHQYHQQRQHTPFSLPTIELSSTATCSGKTQLLYLITAISILPTFYTFSVLSSQTAHLDGKSSSVIILDCDHRFNVHRLSTIIRQYILSRLQPPYPSTEELTSFILSCTKHIHLFRPNSSQSLVSTLSSLRSYLHGNAQPSRPISSIIIDGIGAFYYIDKLASFTAPDTLTQTYRALYTELIKLQSFLHCSIIYTSLLTYSLTEGRYVPLHPLPFLFTFASLRIILYRNLVSPFPMSMPFSQCEKDREKRQKVVERGEFSGFVEKIGRGWGGMEALEALRAASGEQGKGLAVFRFRVVKEGVILNEATEVGEGS